VAGGCVRGIRTLLGIPYSRRRSADKVLHSFPPILARKNHHRLNLTGRRHGIFTHPWPSQSIFSAFQTVDGSVSFVAIIVGMLMLAKARGVVAFSWRVFGQIAGKGVFERGQFVTLRCAPVRLSNRLWMMSNGFKIRGRFCLSRLPSRATRARVLRRSSN
jgi:hypothetical protein